MCSCAPQRRCSVLVRSQRRGTRQTRARAQPASASQAPSLCRTELPLRKYSPWAPRSVRRVLQPHVGTGRTTSIPTSRRATRSVSLIFRLRSTAASPSPRALALAPCGFDAHTSRKIRRACAMKRVLTARGRASSITTALASLFLRSSLSQTSVMVRLRVDTQRSSASSCVRSARLTPRWRTARCAWRRTSRCAPQAMLRSVLA